MWPETTSSEGEDASAGADEVEGGADDDARARGDAAASVREARREKRGGRDEGRAWPPTRASRCVAIKEAGETRRGVNPARHVARSELALAALDFDPIAARFLAETQSAARLLLGRASGFARTRRRCRRRASSPPARSTFACVRAPSPARTRSDASAPSGAEPSPRRVAAMALKLWDAEQAECMLMEGGTQVVSFGTAWCGPCALLAPDLVALGDALEDDAPHVTVAKVDAEEAPGVATAHAVGAYPTTLWLREGREVHRLEGALPAAALVQLTAKHLLTAEEEEVLRVNAPEWFGPALLEPPDAQSGAGARTCSDESGVPRLRARAR